MGSGGYLDLPDSITNLEHQKKRVSSVESYSFFSEWSTEIVIIFLDGFVDWKAAGFAQFSLIGHLIRRCSM